MDLVDEVQSMIRVEELGKDWRGLEGWNASKSLKNLRQEIKDAEYISDVRQN